jgi:hypothetical protein
MAGEVVIAVVVYSKNKGQAQVVQSGVFLKAGQSRK